MASSFQHFSDYGVQQCEHSLYRPNDSVGKFDIVYNLYFLKDKRCSCWRLAVFTKVEKVERTVSSFIKMWLRLSCCLSSINWYRHGAPEVPVWRVQVHQSEARHDHDCLQRHCNTSDCSHVGNSEELDPCFCLQILLANKICSGALQHSGTGSAGKRWV